MFMPAAMAAFKQGIVERYDCTASTPDFKLRLLIVRFIILTLHQQLDSTKMGRK
ncbi:MAG: hypothetical protein GW763_11655 [Paraglaciecola sp.]|nr:hypothetical protein [Paraglaciecola sp.]NCT48624.1 hypothetical protein [Paraglaciecola sp.]